ncbi:MAG: hypothetical protein EOP84_17935 [Verrucomicrobiaceae bacterium]|nr:MAG: hypothetical protein EOP84_17935 [Verrucomicrobiaceae bacterium]
MIAITFAVPEESSRFCRQLKSRRQLRVGSMRVQEGQVGAQLVRVAHIGMGLDAAQRNTELLLENQRPDGLIAAGFGGALITDLKVGDVVVDPRTWNEKEPGWDRPAAWCHKGAILSRPSPLETAAEKEQAFRETGAWVVDMETDAVAAVCAKAGVPMLGVRAISDGARDPLPVPLPAWYDIQAQRPRPAVLVGYLLTHPGVIMPFLRFLRGLPSAQRALAEFLNGFLAGSPAIK